MEKQSKSFPERLALAMAVLTGKEEVNERNALAMEIPTDKGLLVTPFEDLQVGDEAMIEGQTAPDGEYLAENGQVLVVMGGLVSEIKEMVEPENEELALLKAENESLKAQISELSTVSESALAKLEELAKKGSSYTPPASAQTFRKVETPTVESYEERKQRLYSNK